ncbi:hypothetical protein [Streptomyces sp. NPDC002851]
MVQGPVLTEAAAKGTADGATVPAAAPGGRPEAAAPRRRPAGSPGIRKLLTVVHVVSSVGLLGCTAGQVVLALCGALTDDGQLARAAYRFMRLGAHSVALPLLLTGLVSGVLLALVTRWGLLRHKWVFLKEVQLLLVLVIGVVFLRPWIEVLVQRTVAATATGAELGAERWLLAGGEMLQVGLLTLATVVSVYKPKGRIRFRRSGEQAERVERVEQAERVEQGGTA